MLGGSGRNLATTRISKTDPRLDGAFERFLTPVLYAIEICVGPIDPLKRLADLPAMS